MAWQQKKLRFKQAVRDDLSLPPTKPACVPASHRVCHAEVEPRASRLTKNDPARPHSPPLSDSVRVTVAPRAGEVAAADG